MSQFRRIIHFWCPTIATIILSKGEHNNCQVHDVFSTKTVITAEEENQILVIPTNSFEIPNCQSRLQLILQPAVYQKQ